MRKDTTKIIERASNGGMHRQKAFRQIKTMLTGHGYRDPRLYHLILLDGVACTDARPFLVALKALCRTMRAAGIETRWRGCLERDDKKGLHFHVFILANAFVETPCKYINTSSKGFLRSMLERRGMGFHLAKPKSDMHKVGDVFTGKRRNYAYVSRDKLDDCIEWISYLAKARSKPDDIRGIYFSSRDGLDRKATDGVTTDARLLHAANDLESALHA